MKITKRQLQKLIKEEAADCVKDLMAMGYSRSQAYRECDDDDDDDYDYPHYGHRSDDYYNDYGYQREGKNTMKITRRQLRRVIREAMDAQLNRPFSQPDRNVEPSQLWDNVIGEILEDRGMDRQDFLEDWDKAVRFLTVHTINSQPRDEHLTPAEASEEVGKRIMQKFLEDKRFRTSDTAGRRQIYADATIKTFAELVRAMNDNPHREELRQGRLDLR